VILFLKYEGNQLDLFEIYFLSVHKHSDTQTQTGAASTKAVFMQLISDVLNFQAYLAGLNYKGDSSELWGIL